jgi:hypothetical protein
MFGLLIGLVLGCLPGEKTRSSKKTGGDRLA